MKPSSFFFSILSSLFDVPLLLHYSSIDHDVTIGSQLFIPSQIQIPSYTVQGLVGDCNICDNVPHS